MDAGTMRILKGTAGVLALLLLAATAGYYFASPKVELSNRSGRAYDEFRLQLPTSRVTIGPIASNAVERVYFSPQDSSGTAHYSLWHHDQQLARGEFPYAQQGQLFRTLQVVLLPDTRVVISGSDD